MKILQLMRWKNLLIITIAQLLLAFFLFNHQVTKIPLGIYLFILATILNAGSGYIINDIIDIETDQINLKYRILVSKQISIPNAKFLAYFLILTSIIISILYSVQYQRYIYFYSNVFVIISLHIYNNYLKQLPIVGNIVTAGLTSLSLLLFLMFPLTFSAYQKQWLIQLSIFCFLLNLCREIIKDIEDYYGDKATSQKTLAVLLGITTAKKITLLVLLVTIVYIIIFLAVTTTTYAILLFFSLILFALQYIYIQVTKATHPNQFKKISKLLKIVIAFGILSTLIL